MEISIEKLAENYYNFKSEQFKPSFVEEFIVKHGRFADQIDVPYLCRKERVSHGRVRKDIQKVFGKQAFDIDPNKNQVTKEEFMSIYEFGLYPNVREWVGHVFLSTGKLLTREKLFQYLTEDNIDERWEVTPNDSFV